MEYFKKLLDLLKIEREEDLDAYRKLTAASSATQRRTNGLSWYPIAIRGTEMSRGDYITVEIERTTHHELSHQFRFGSSAALFSNHEPGKDRIEGTINYIGGNRIKITLRTEELPDWARDGKLGLDLLFDNNSYDEMQNALKTASGIDDTDGTAEARLASVLTGKSKPGFKPKVHDLYKVSTSLNNKQQEAVEKILSANELAIVHGPPGTGKTTTLVQAIKALIAQNHKQILVVAPSNTAVDLLSEKLANEQLNVVRVGNPARVSEGLLSLTLDRRMAEHEGNKDIKNLKKMAAEYKNMAHKYKRNFGKAEKEQRKALFNEAHKIRKEVDKIEEYIIGNVIEKAQVITATLVGANHYTIRNLKFDTVVIDEAGQALEPACWIPILKAEKLVLAGDHCQLPPTIKSVEAARKGLSSTLLEKCVNLHPEAVVLLQEQYRMNELIMGYPSNVFYQGQLRANANVATGRLLNNEQALEFVDTAGCSFDEKLEGTSSTNPEEALFLKKHLEQLISNLDTHYTEDTFPTIGVIFPYQQQVILFREVFEGSEILPKYRTKITINSIDGFQGQERDIIYIGLTRSNPEGNIGFLTDIRRMNVAMTRARKKLVVIGDSATISRNEFYADFIAYSDKNEAYKSAWEFL
ncbi:AAA domain-containing protein [Pedobacter sp. MC2016-14]|uniref:AAA domain-containing protein n=1 Tax=Pedobacter sp. MC2016-14 TaxID=2897327 RepID=UPI001E34A53A|nr:AAA domain-containing protein [Pedobacter sp. MC2016-14]MCD0489869.1 AAA domain-containing protein [Pedobacter sp. MC2016-14]